MTPQEMTELRTNRFKTAVALGKPDRVPISLNGPCFIKFGDPSAKMADYIRRPKWADEMVLKAYSLPVLEEIDAPPAAGMNIEAFGAMWFSRMKLPGRELPEDAIWQIDEQGPMTEEDYDTLIDKGWNYVSRELQQRIGFSPDFFAPKPEDIEYMAEFQKKVDQMGRAKLGGGLFAGAAPTFETLSAARSISRFYKDLHRIPDKVSAALEVMEKEILEGVRKAVRESKPLWAGIGGTRAGSDFISRKTFEKFYWPFVKHCADVAIEEGSNIFFHMDSNWEGFLPYFTEVPKGRGIFDPDSLTDIFKIKEVLGGHMCITGDVSPALLTLGTSDEVYRYSKRLVDEIGPAGFIMSSGCSVPPNAKLENVKAMILACLE
ncbi:MAG: uroporphyrinogen decarboxylase family protein [Clostridiales bacterium]|jgi:hypothetical protein|nr:uroporphyrinogen-III decarboxylase [Eubacteriales bacterium]MDH7565635.1 uroporphyrinogen decarboxylase family protein [Clostridiales bacterium]